MERCIARANIDHFLHLLEDANTASDVRATVMKLLIQEEAKLGFDLEQLQFAKDRVATGRERLNRPKQELAGTSDHQLRAKLEL
jgi:hypothetical protein